MEIMSKEGEIRVGTQLSEALGSIPSNTHAHMHVCVHTHRRWVVLIRYLTSIPVLQDLAAHGIFGCLRAAEILSINPEARVVFLYQVTIVADYCYEREERSHRICQSIYHLPASSSQR